MRAIPSPSTRRHCPPLKAGERVRILVRCRGARYGTIGRTIDAGVMVAVEFADGGIGLFQHHELARVD